MTMKYTAVAAISLLFLSRSHAFLSPAARRPTRTSSSLWVQGTSYTDLLKTSSNDDDDENDQKPILPTDSSWNSITDYRQAVRTKHADLYKEMLDYDEVKEAQQNIARLQKQIDKDTRELEYMLEEEENLQDDVFQKETTVNGATTNENDNESVTLEAFLESQHVPVEEEEAGMEMTDLLFPAWKKKKNPVAADEVLAVDEKEPDIKVQDETKEEAPDTTFSTVADDLKEKTTIPQAVHDDSSQDAALLGMSPEKEDELDIPQEGAQVEALAQLAATPELVTPEVSATKESDTIADEESMSDAALIDMALEENDLLEFPKEGVQVEALDQLALSQEEAVVEPPNNKIVEEKESTSDAALIDMALEDEDELEIPKEGVQVEALDQLAVSPEEAVVEPTNNKIFEEQESTSDAALIDMALEEEDDLEIPKEGVQVEALDQLAVTPEETVVESTNNKVVEEKESTSDAALIDMALEDEDELDIPKEGVQVEALEQLAVTPEETVVEPTNNKVVEEQESTFDAALIDMALEDEDDDELEIPKEGAQVEALDQSPLETVVEPTINKVVEEQESTSDAALIDMALEDEDELEIPKEGGQVEALDQLAATQEVETPAVPVVEETSNEPQIIAESELKVESKDEPMFAVDEEAETVETQKPVVALKEATNDEVMPTEGAQREEPEVSETLEEFSKDTLLVPETDDRVVLTAELVMPEEKIPQALVPLKKVTIREPFWVGTTHQEITSSLVQSLTPQESFGQLMKKDETGLFLRTGALLAKTALSSGKAAMFAAQALGEAVSDKEVNEYAAQLPTRRLEAVGAVCGAMTQCLRSSSSSQHAVEAVSETSQNLVSAMVSAAALGVKRVASATTWFRRVKEERIEREKVMAEKQRVQAEKWRVQAEKRRQEELLEKKRREAEKLLEEKRIAAEKALEDRLERQAREEQERLEAERAALREAALDKLRRDAEEEKQRVTASVTLDSDENPSKKASSGMFFFADEA